MKGSIVNLSMFKRETTSHTFYFKAANLSNCTKKSMDIPQYRHYANVERKHNILYIW